MAAILTGIPTPDPRTLDEAGQALANAIGDRYAIRGLIGRGGMGVVYLARDKRLERLVALKTLPPHLSADASVRDRFLRETRLAASLSHQNIVAVHGADDVAGHVFFVMRYVEGESLAARIRENGRLDAPSTCRYMRDVASALGHAHSRGVIHRDIKAENILIERETDCALVTDFGIARLAEAAPLTATGQLLGTVYYVSPEQVTGDPVDARSDLYALGVVGFYALTGRFPFESDLASAVLVAHVMKPAPQVASLADIPVSLATIIDRCLEKDRARRFANADELLAALETARGEMTRAGGRGPNAVPRPLVSDTEAHAVWHRAAELEALTGSSPSPTIPARARDAEADARRTSGFALTDIRSAAAEVGIGAKYLARALAERGLERPPGGPLPSPTEAPRPARERLLPRGIARSTYVLERTKVVDHELTQADIDEMLVTLRAVTGQTGRPLAQRGALIWQHRGFVNTLDVAVLPRVGHTDIRVTEDLASQAHTTWLAGILLATVFGAAAAVFVDEAGGGAAELFGTVAGIVGVVTSISAAAQSVRKAVRHANARLFALTEALAAHVRPPADQPKR